MTAPSKHRIVIIGSGRAGAALHAGLSCAGYDVRFARKRRVSETTSEADVIVLAVPFGVVREVARELKSAADGKTVIDVTNALSWPWGSGRARLVFGAGRDRGREARWN